LHAQQHMTDTLLEWRRRFRTAACLRADECGAPATVLAEFLYVAGDGDPFGDDESVLQLDPVTCARSFFDSWCRSQWPTYDGAALLWTWCEPESANGDVDFLLGSESGRWLIRDSEGDAYLWDLDGITWQQVEVRNGDRLTTDVRPVDRISAWPRVGLPAVVVFEGARGRDWFHESAPVTSIRRVPTHD
jgi:hypothetical protein